MKIHAYGRPGAVQFPFPVPSRVQGAHRTLQTAKGMSIVINASAQSLAGHSPLLLRLAQWTGSSSLPPWAHDLGRFRRVTVQLPRLSASKAGLSETAQKAAEAEFSDQLHALVGPRHKHTPCSQSHA